MPRIQLERIFPNDSINLRSILLWPGINDVERRKQFFAADYANGFVHDGDENAVYPWKTVLIRTLLEAPSWSDLKQQVAERTRRGVIAGYVFCFMFLMEQYKDRIPKRGC